MNHQHSSHEHPDDTERKISRSRLVSIGFLLVIGYFLWTEHRAHVIQFLPFLLLAACPLMHFFMHHGHGHGHGQRDERNDMGQKGER
ncbi:hypothetical protein BKK81_28110 [Cupriavidus sp. USMAHM13]|uniref:DUF2933 domain-containing protein n=1 Tax=Cupriavidus malaysiensis TaxID=367825 RepID=A0ABM6FAC6_9BURK|nr:MULTISPECIES: DUF2933 domain-containing protein [Cupriavidus]AOZ03016.1 hypothetical protein BKK81_28110 [Cupriavidus sp. USMAHM13]AOZ08625.1 hypothetical protein BKK80_22060 [Cupriavidus malaysiensis]